MRCYPYFPSCVRGEGDEIRHAKEKLRQAQASGDVVQVSVLQDYLRELKAEKPNTERRRRLQQQQQAKPVMKPLPKEKPHGV